MVGRDGGEALLDPLSSPRPNGATEAVCSRKVEQPHRDGVAPPANPSAWHIAQGAVRHPTGEVSASTSQSSGQIAGEAISPMARGEGCLEPAVAELTSASPLAPNEIAISSSPFFHIGKAQPTECKSSVEWILRSRQRLLPLPNLNRLVDWSHPHKPKRLEVACQGHRLFGTRSTGQSPEITKGVV